MNEKGFVSSSLILFAPFLLALMVSGLSGLWFINKTNQLNNLCYRHLLQAQEALVNGNQKVLWLNPQAKSLMTQKKAITAALLVAPPPAKPALLRQRAKILLQQKNLRAQQTSLFFISQAKAQARASELRAKTLVFFHSLGQAWRSNKYLYGDISISFPKSALTVEIQDTAPTYKRAKKHALQQTLQMSWIFPLKRLSPQWIQRYVPLARNWSGSCSTHPSKGGHQWFAAIGKGKHLSKLSF